MKINNLSDMVTFFDEILYKNHDRFQKEKLNATNQLKSYIVENHIHTHKKDMSDLIVEFFHNLNKDLKKCDFKITQTQDENLYINESAHGKIFIDTSNNRFWKIHSVAKAEISDYFHQTLLKKRNLDQIWLPIPFLLGLKKYGNTYGMGISFTEHLKKDELDDKLFENQDTLNINIRRLYVDEMLKLLNDSPLRSVMGINKISLIDPSNEDGEESYIIDDITYYGKITGRGTSFTKHNYMLYNILKNYEKQILHIEKQYSFDFEEHTHTIKGFPIEINFNRPDIDLQKLVKILFLGKKPFHLWGIPDWKNENFCKVTAIDLHNGNYANSIDFEITNKLLRAFLPQGACGNSIARLLTNIHQSIDATSVMEGVHGDEFFSII
ncbi:hypothetical protein PDL06_11135 [Bacillus cereus group sp. TH208-1LC]|uniref:hypothetical protein n=1 Tax=Bacillus cereus group TaxID=86661 RepID=UPI000935DCD3|nr:MULTISPECIES: hypothetical protein [Bacillus cereus group]ASI80360.1 hypothetical protein BA202_25020 [Bacillus cereus]MDA1606705.1 hypothetical protein [Bacillus cereus group sp. TH208-1LC]